MGNRPKNENRALHTDLLRETQLFAGLRDEQLAAITRLCRQVHCHSGQILLSEGDEISEVLVVLDGEVTVEVKLFQGFQLRPNAAAVEKVGADGVIGCCALLKDCANMTARCTQDTHIIAINAGELRGFLASHPDIGLIVLQNAFRMATDRLVAARQQLIAQFGLSEMYETYRHY
jgi:CRP-like cAMP-binding protein